MLKIENLTKFYGPIKGVEELSLEVKKGEIFGFIGPNGSGKSTTIRCIMNLINKTSGKIIINGRINQKDDLEIKKIVGYLPTEVNLYDDLTVKEMLDYNESFYEKDCHKRRRELVQHLQVEESKKLEDLSQGNLKKVGIILALMHQPKLIILDEPTSGLDPLMQEEFYRILLEEKKRGATIFCSTHILGEIKKICDRVGIIKDGNLIKIESLNELKNNQFEIITIKSKEITKIKKKLKGKIITEDKETLKILYSQPIDELINILSQYKIEKILIEDPEIEELFLHYYQ